MSEDKEDKSIVRDILDSNLFDESSNFVRLMRYVVTNETCGVCLQHKAYAIIQENNYKDLH